MVGYLPSIHWDQSPELGVSSGVCLCVCVSVESRDGGWDVEKGMQRSDKEEFQISLILKFALCPPNTLASQSLLKAIHASLQSPSEHQASVFLLEK